jgi:hypothetical protein
VATETEVEAVLIEEAMDKTRGLAQYWALYRTAFGVVRTSISRSETSSKAGGRDVYGTAELFSLSGPEPRHWHVVVGLLRGEMAAKDLQCHGDFSDADVEKCRTDSARVLDRALLILSTDAGARST